MNQARMSILPAAVMLLGQLVWSGSQCHAISHTFSDLAVRVAAAKGSSGKPVISVTGHDHAGCPLCQVGARSAAVVAPAHGFVGQISRAESSLHVPVRHSVLFICVLPPGRAPPAPIA